MIRRKYPSLSFISSTTGARRSRSLLSISVVQGLNGGKSVIKTRTRHILSLSKCHYHPSTSLSPLPLVTRTRTTTATTVTTSTTRSPMSSSMKQISQVIKEALSRLKPTIINNDDEHTKARDKKSHANLDEIGKERNIKDEEKSDVEIIYTPTSHWPFQTLPARDPDHDEHQKRRSMPIRILVLDSSFNPPTKAHLALASIALRSLITQSEDRSGDSSGVEDGGPEDNRGHDAHLLLLS
ncbi:hypothetical protein FRC20_006915, partial [Serendipita sp. 405]